MNAKHEPSAEKKALVDTLLAIDSRMPTSSAEGRNVAKEVLRRDRRRVRILTWVTSGLLLLMVIGLCRAAFWYYTNAVPEMDRLRRGIPAMYSDIYKLNPQSSTLDPLAKSAIYTIGECHMLYMILLATMRGILVMLTIMLAGAVCTFLLIRATRGATLRQIQASLLALSEQFDALQRSLPDSHSAGGAQATRERSG
jgi:hypothetical protein